MGLIGFHMMVISYPSQFEMVWASMIHNVGQEIFGGLVFILPLEGNIIAAQDQKRIYTYHKWRGGQRRVGYFVYQVQVFSPPTLQELKVEEDFQELPCWEVTHFVWMIAWGWEIYMGMIDPNLYQTSFLEKEFRQPIVASMDILLLHDDSYLGCKIGRAHV